MFDSSCLLVGKHLEECIRLYTKEAIYLSLLKLSFQSEHHIIELTDGGVLSLQKQHNVMKDFQSIVEEGQVNLKGVRAVNAYYAYNA